MKRHVVISGCLAAAFSLAAAGAIADDRDRDDLPHIFTATPIKHLVVIFQENVSFDHYFGTYPFAQNNAGETPFKASQRTPKSINTLLTLGKSGAPCLKQARSARHSSERLGLMNAHESSQVLH